MDNVFKFGDTSNDRLITCDPRLVIVGHCVLALGLIDFSVTDGYRGEELQNTYYHAGKSQLRYPDSKHNHRPLSHAIHFVPWINGALSYNRLHCCFLAGLILAAAQPLDITIRWGGNWDMDAEPITDQEFQDLVHYEVIE